MPEVRIGIDLGGTKIEGVRIVDGQEEPRIREDTPREDYRGTIEAIAELVERLTRDAPDRPTVGIGTPGAISPATGRKTRPGSARSAGCTRTR